MIFCQFLLIAHKLVIYLEYSPNTNSLESRLKSQGKLLSTTGKLGDMCMKFSVLAHMLSFMKYVSFFSKMFIFTAVLSFVVPQQMKNIKSKHFSDPPGKDNLETKNAPGNFPRPPPY